MMNVDLPTILNINMIISMPCIIIIILVYTWLPELRNIHGKCLICYLIFLVSANIVVVSGEQRIGKYYFFINAGLEICLMQWTHVTTFDIWRNLKSLQWNANRKESECLRFCLYTLYVCLTPFLLYEMLVLMQLMDIDKNIALNTIYAYLIALSIVNVFFFLLTVWHIFQTNQEVIDRGENQRYIDRFNVEKQRFVLYFRMFIVTGIFTSIGIFLNFYIENLTLSYGLDVFLSLQPILLFILLVLKRSTKDKILKRWQGTTNKVRLLFHVNVTPTSSTSKTSSTDI